MYMQLLENVYDSNLAPSPGAQGFTGQNTWGEDGHVFEIPLKGF